MQVEEYAPIKEGSNAEKDSINISIPRDRLMVFPFGVEAEIES